MREIKFRAWEKSTKQMIPVYNIDFDTNMINTRSAWRMFTELELMQYTGLTDKNGKEIYEGDILTLWRSLSVSGEPRGEYYTPLPVVYEPLWCQFVAEDKDSKENYRIWQDFDAFEVIGNIYENPELLEVK